MSRACARTWSGGPSISTAESVADPGCSTTIRSTRSFQTETRCSTTTRVAPVLSRQRPTASRTSRTPAGSRLAVGSSSRISPGRIARMPASASRCFWPPERADVGWSSGSRPSPTSSSASARVARSPPGARRGFPRRRRRRRRGGRAPPGSPGPAASARPGRAGRGAGRRRSAGCRSRPRPRRPPAAAAAGQAAGGAVAEHPGQGVEQRGLAGARRPQQQHALPGPDVQVQAADGGPGPAGVPPAPAPRGDRGRADRCRRTC